MVRVQLIFNELPFEPYGKFNKDLIRGIKEKVNNKEVGFTVVPTTEMVIDLSTFEGNYRFSEKQMEAICDCNMLYIIDTIIITSSNIELRIS